VALRLAMSFLCHQSEYICIDSGLTLNLQNFDNSQNFLRFHPLSLVFILLVFAIAAYGQQTSVAVLPSDGSVLNNDELEALTGEMREAALKVLPRNAFVLLKQDVLVKRLGGPEKFIEECRESSCIVELGKKAQVDYVSQASVSRLGNRIRLNVELHDVQTEGLVGIVNDDAENIRGLLAIVKNRVPLEVFGKIPGASIKVLETERPKQVEKQTRIEVLEAVCPNGSYKNSQGNTVCRPSANNAGRATAVCRDGTYSYSQNRRGTCSGHGGVARWL